MPIELVTTSDLLQFRAQLIRDITQLISADKPVATRVLKTKEVCKLLTVTPGTLQNWRKCGAVKYSKIGGVIYYQYSDVERLIKGKVV